MDTQKKTYLIGLLFTALLKFVLLKNSQMKSTKSKLTRDRMDTQKSLFPKLIKKFQIFKHLSDSALKVPGKQTKSTVNICFGSLSIRIAFS